jgi:hypothetical protein
MCCPQGSGSDGGHSSDGSGIDKAFRRLVQADAGVIEQVDQLDDHDRRQPQILYSP